jgi:hypothetical protein
MAELNGSSSDLDWLSEFFKIRQRRLYCEHASKEAKANLKKAKDEEAAFVDSRLMPHTYRRRADLHMPQLELLEIPGLNLAFLTGDEPGDGGDLED